MASFPSTPLQIFSACWSLRKSLLFGCDLRSWRFYSTNRTKVNSRSIPSLLWLGCAPPSQCGRREVSSSRKIQQAKNRLIVPPTTTVHIHTNAQDAPKKRSQTFLPGHTSMAAARKIPSIGRRAEPAGELGLARLPHDLVLAHLKVPSPPRGSGQGAPAADIASVV